MQPAAADEVALAVPQSVVYLPYQIVAVEGIVAIIGRITTQPDIGIGYDAGPSS
jgi:hypothetical protein